MLTFSLHCYSNPSLNYNPSSVNDDISDDVHDNESFDSPSYLLNLDIPIGDDNENGDHNDDSVENELSW